MLVCVYVCVLVCVCAFSARACVCVCACVCVRSARLPARFSAADCAVVLVSCCGHGRSLKVYEATAKWAQLYPKKVEFQQQDFQRAPQAAEIAAFGQEMLGLDVEGERSHWRDFCTHLCL